MIARPLPCASCCQVLVVVAVVAAAFAAQLLVQPFKTQVGPLAPPGVVRRAVRAVRGCGLP
jgi:hypothetical protein